MLNHSEVLYIKQKKGKYMNKLGIVFKNRNLSKKCFLFLKIHQFSISINRSITNFYKKKSVFRCQILDLI